jgi:hypothetical protein
MSSIRLLIKEEKRMPKDPAENMPNYKIGGGQLNEYEFTQNQRAIAEEKKQQKKPQEQNIKDVASTSKSSKKRSDTETGKPKVAKVSASSSQAKKSVKQSSKTANKKGTKKSTKRS